MLHAATHWLFKQVHRGPCIVQLVQTLNAKRGKDDYTRGIIEAYAHAKQESKRTATPKYLTSEDEELSSAIRMMVWRSAWGRWYAAQHLANNEHKPAREASLFMAASSLVLDEAMNGNLEIKGRRPDGIAYEPIPKETWRLAFLREVDADPRALWRTKPAPRDGVDPKRIQTLLDYDSLTVRSEQFERIWPRDDPETDRVRKELLKKAAAAGVSADEIKALS